MLRGSVALAIVLLAAPGCYPFADFTGIDDHPGAGSGSDAASTGAGGPVDPGGGAAAQGGAGTGGAGGAGGGGGAGASDEPYGPGDQLLTLAATPLQEQEGPVSEVVRDLPIGGRLFVTAPSGKSGWVRVDYWGEAGYVAMDAVEPTQAVQYDIGRSTLLSEKALELWDGQEAMGMALGGVRQSAEQSGILPDPPGWTPTFDNSIEWGQWAVDNPAEMRLRGLERAAVPINQLPWGDHRVATRAVRPPRPVRQRRDRRRVSVGKGCSDHCDAIDTTCGDTWVHVPA